MATGVLVSESLRAGANLRSLQLTVTQISRAHVDNATLKQPLLWTLINFEIPDAEAGAFAQAMSEALDQGPWYVDLHTPHESFIVFPRRVWRYRRGDEKALAEAQAYGRTLGIPETQIDWRV